MNLADWINKEVHLRARQIEDGMARRLLMEAEHLSGLTEYEAKERLGILLDGMRMTEIVSRRDAKPRESWGEGMPEGTWVAARRVWESDPRDGWAWLKRELDLPVSKPAIRKRALKEEWEKRRGFFPVLPTSARMICERKEA